jgi:hypothetical protein
MESIATWSSQLAVVGLRTLLRSPIPRAAEKFAASVPVRPSDVSADLMRDDTPKGNVIAIPVTMFGIGLRSTVAESPDEVRGIWTRDLRKIATEALARQASKKGNPS